MKYKFVKKGTEISSENINGLMDFGQVMDKAAGMGMGSAPLAKGALGAKTASLTKILWVLAVPFTVSVYFAVTELTSEPTETEAEAPVELETTQSPIQIIVPDSAEVQRIAEAQEAAAKDAPPARADAKPATPPVSEPIEEMEAEEILIKEDIMIKAEPIGGFPAFYELIDKELTYPETARISNLEGFVRVYFVVDKEGKAGKFRVVRSMGDEFDQEALRVMKKIPNWNPATHNGQPVSSHLSIKLRFELKKKADSGNLKEKQ